MKHFIALYLLLVSTIINAQFPQGSFKAQLPHGSFPAGVKFPYGSFPQGNSTNSHEEYAENIKLIFYVGLKPEDIEIIPLKQIESLLQNPHFDVSKTTVFFCPGFIQTTNSALTRHLMDSYTGTKRYNALEIDWTKYSLNIVYKQAAKDTYMVGETLAQYIQKLIDCGVNINHITLTGLSLGAHIVGTIGRNLKQKVPLIVGLDPAGPNFGLDSKHFAKGDGARTIAVHTDAGQYGTQWVDADLDLLINGGKRIQPGCPIYTLPFSLPDFCSHCKSVDFWGDKIRHPEPFVAYKCNDPIISHQNNCTDMSKEIINLANSNISGVYDVKYPEQ